MKIRIATIVAFALLAPAVARAQESESRPHPEPRPLRTKATTADQEFSLGQLTPTSEMWLYQQSLRRYSDPQAAVRRRAEFEADQRQARLAAQRWFGYSNSRPTVSPTPFTGNYSPMWTSNSPYSTEWRGVNSATIVVPMAPPRSTAAYGLW
jgi:hypothetical protein